MPRAKKFLSVIKSKNNRFIYISSFNGLYHKGASLKKSRGNIIIQLYLIVSIHKISIDNNCNSLYYIKT